MGNAKESHESHNNSAVPHDGSSTRHEIRGRGGRGGRGGGDGRNSNRWTKGPRWSRDGSDNGQSGWDHGPNRGQRSNTPPLHRPVDTENKHRPPGAAYTVEPQVDPRDTWPKRSERGRGERARGPLLRDKDLNQEQFGEAAANQASIEHLELEHEQRNQKGWRAGGGGWQPTPRKQGPPAFHPSDIRNWRERETFHVEGEKGELREGKEEVVQKGGSGRNKWKRPRLHEQEQRKLVGAERRTGPVKRMEVPKSKETQTGERDFIV